MPNNATTPSAGRVRLISLGAPLGNLVLPDGRPIGPPKTVFWVRVAGTFAALDQTSAEIWQDSTGFAALDDLVDRGRERSDIDDLVATKLLLQFPDTDAPVSRLSEIFRDIVPVPLAVGLGSDPNDVNDLILADGRGVDLLRLCFVDYVLWTYMDGRLSLPEVVEAGELHLAVDPGSLWPRAVQLIETAIAVRALFLDRR